MASVEVVCPSGMAVEVRGLTVREANLLANATRKKRLSMLDQVLTNCWKGTSDLGPYQFSADGAPPWDDILQGDAQFLLIQVRIATYGAEYIFKHQCDDSSCRERFEWQLDLNKVPIQKLMPEDGASFKEGNVFSADLNGTRFKFLLATGATAKKADRHRANNRNSMMTLALRMRITEIEGVDQQDMRRYIDAMDMGTATDLMAEMDAHDCGVDGDIEVECAECGNIMEVSLPFESAFFMPDKKKKAKKKAAEKAGRPGAEAL